LQFQGFIERLKDSLASDLPGDAAHAVMSPLGRVLGERAKELVPNPKKSAVLILLYIHQDELHTLLMQRSSYNGVHSAQMSFPGGKFEKEDISLEQTALREFKEEIGAEVGQERVLGKLTNLIIPPSGFEVEPYLAFCNSRPEFNPNKYEVEQLLEVSLDLLFNDSIKQISTVLAANSSLKMKVPAYVVNNQIVWGATAMIISELEVLFKRLDF
jgi:8-oxo-dGTP pyrophosphatase MutT (NUDIX family)